MSTFRFSLRDLLLITLCVGICSAWWLDRNQLARNAASAIHKQAEAEGSLKDITDYALSLESALRKENLGIARKTGQTGVTLHRMDPIYGDR